jgi:hypothetical protein
MRAHHHVSAVRAVQQPSGRSNGEESFYAESHQILQDDHCGRRADAEITDQGDFSCCLMQQNRISEKAV